MDISQPIILGLSGKIATGKTTVADGLAPMAQSIDSTDRIFWTHLYFALPLYAMAAIRQKTIGEDAFDRQCFLLHDALNDLFKGWITYEETVDTVYELATLECEPTGKPRTFLQKAGTEVCRSFDPDCFPKWMYRKVQQEYQRFQREMESMSVEAYGPPLKHFGVVISDVRFANEVNFIDSMPNSVLVKFIARPEVVTERVYDRDGVFITPEQSVHASERGLDDVPDSMFDAIIDSSDMTKQEQVNEVRTLVEKRL